MCTTLRLRARSTPKRIPTMQHGSYSQTIMDHTLAATLRYKSRLSPTDQIFNSAGGNPTITCMELFEDWNILVVANEAGFLSLIDLYDTDDDVTRSSHIVPIFTGTRDTKSDTLAVTSDELQPCIVYSGCRDGGVRLFDIRVAPLSQSSRNGLFGNGSFLEENAGYKQRTSYKQRYGGPAHNSAISKLVNWGDHCLITSSLDNSICHWDIRMPSIPTIEYMPDLEPAAKFKEFSKRKYEAGSRCVCKYAGHINESTFGLGMAINSSKTVLAAGGEDGGVRMWDVNSGRLLSRTEPKEAASHRNKQLSGSTATTAADNTAQKNSRGNQGHLIDDLAFPSCQRAGLSANAQLVRSLVFYEPDQRYCTIREPESLRSVIEYGLLVSRGSEIAMYH
ncbi:DDB1- and CUL4-associated factor 4 [Mycoemilia scoparia]|uniref:DDB1- and CUL4-associated factor 4 n=1 Tax=Mycoemilia scoparia TaxID=417184 RepID=A0A9W8A8P2_9FUNG|nr:DDB1- and CUL4-associated factor 4 [Mycoemilia scoparia]